MSPWTEKSNRQRTTGAAKSVRSASLARRKVGDGMIFIADQELLKKFPWLLACDNVRTDRS